MKNYREMTEAELDAAAVDRRHPRHGGAKGHREVRAVNDVGIDRGQCPVLPEVAGCQAGRRLNPCAQTDVPR